MKLHRDQDAALIIVGELALHATGLVSLSEIASKHGLSVLFLKKIAKQLREAGIVISKEGLGGGYTLAKLPQHITAWDVLTAVSDHKSDVTRGSQLTTHCPLLDTCLPQHIHKEVRDALKQGLITLTYDRLVPTSFRKERYVH